jgi:hypothetical protein
MSGYSDTDLCFRGMGKMCKNRLQKTVHPLLVQGILSGLLFGIPNLGSLATNSQVETLDLVTSSHLFDKEYITSIPKGLFSSSSIGTDPKLVFQHLTMVLYEGLVISP